MAEVKCHLPWRKVKLAMSPATGILLPEVLSRRLNGRRRIVEIKRQADSAWHLFLEAKVFVALAGAFGIAMKAGESVAVALFARGAAGRQAE